MRCHKLSALTAALSFTVVLFLLTTCTRAAAGTETVLHSFTGPDGYEIVAGLVTDAAGNLYGVAYSGGANGLGSVFELSPQPGGGWTENTLYSFQNNCLDGANPAGTLIFDSAGNLYGTTVDGGTYSTLCNSQSDPGYGTVFELSPPTGGSGVWAETILYSFAGNADGHHDGANPMAGVISDAAGNLYGTTEYGINGGTVFELEKARGWRRVLIHEFDGPGGDGILPVAGLVMDASGNLYGTTSEGLSENGEGTVFELTPQSGGVWTESVLHTFLEHGGTGTNPNGLVIDAAGNLYGTTMGNGIATDTRVISDVFELSPATYAFSVLHRFTGSENGRDILAGLVFDSAGNLYGTSYLGGIGNDCPVSIAPGCGTAFKLTPGADGSWTEQPLHSFSADGDGFWPHASLIFGVDGNLYGTSYAGGDLAACAPNTVDGCGTVFEITP